MPISVKDLTFKYNPGTPFETRALDGITLDINDGEFIGIIGHTGSGKSTFIQHLNAL
ncbi:MAG: ATP-binding cassette domain-containing protein, partial [Clostridia bacterium]|nr:ATP-binding cassette domain-containing protein [Clostridia bacterium]